MSTNKSENLDLHLWVPSDNVSRAEFNENFETLDQAVHVLDESVNVLKGSVDGLNTLDPVSRTQYDADKAKAAEDLSREVSALNASINQNVQAINASISQNVQAINASINSVASANRLEFLTSGTTSVTLPSLTQYQLLLVFCIGGVWLYFNGDQSTLSYTAMASNTNPGLFCSTAGGMAVIFPYKTQVAGFSLEMNDGLYNHCAYYTAGNWSTLKTFTNRYSGTILVYGLK